MGWRKKRREEQRRKLGRREVLKKVRKEGWKKGYHGSIEGRKKEGNEEEGRRVDQKEGNDWLMKG